MICLGSHTDEDDVMLLCGDAMYKRDLSRASRDTRRREIRSPDGRGVRSKLALPSVSVRRGDRLRRGGRGRAHGGRG